MISTQAIVLQDAIRERTALIGVIGLGYVGLPLALRLSESNFHVLGLDTDSAKIEVLKRGECYISHIEAGRVKRLMEEGRLCVTADLSRLGEPDALLICVPTPLTPQREPDLSFVTNTSEAIARTLRPGQMVILESTTFPGTTDEVVQPILESSGLICGRDFFLGYSPEREDPGNEQHTGNRIPKILGGVDQMSGALAEQLYSSIVPQTVRVSSARVAEATKLTENIFRAVNIALVNELKMVYQRMDIDIWEVLDAASTKPFGFMRFNPGPGWGGHCIPIDPFYLSWKAREFGRATHFIELAGEINVRMHEYVIERLQQALNGRGKPVKESRILILGIAYKKDITDSRESPAFELIDQLLRQEALVSYHDPHIARVPRLRSWPGLEGMESIPLTADNLMASDVVLLVTDHSCVDYEQVLHHAPLIVDTRGIYRAGNPKVVKA
ncbi:MAG: nucleotide sugar dehydrogenase [Thermoanaerobaculia bacterium]